MASRVTPGVGLSGTSLVPTSASRILAAWSLHFPGYRPDSTR